MAPDRVPDPEVLAPIGEHFAAGFFELPDASPLRRWSRAVRRYLEHRPLPPFQGKPLYPCGSELEALGHLVLCPSYSFTWSYNDEEVERRLTDPRPEEAVTPRALRARMRALDASFDDIVTPRRRPRVHAQHPELRPRDPRRAGSVRPARERRPRRRGPASRRP